MCYVGTNARSPIWLKKFLLSPIVVDAIFTFHVYFPCLFFVLYTYSVRIHVPCLFFVLYIYSVRIHERCGICVDLYMIYNYMLGIALLDSFRGWFYYVFIRGKEKRSEGDLYNWGYPDSFKPKTLLLTDGNHLLTRKGPEQVGSFYSKTLTLITETGQKYTHPCVAQSLL